MRALIGPDAFLDQFLINDEVLDRNLEEEDFFPRPSNETSDVPLQDMYNRGLVVPQRGLERSNLQLEGREKRCGLTGYIPSMEESLKAGGSPKPKTIIMVLGEPSKQEKELSLARRGLKR